MKERRKAFEKGSEQRSLIVKFISLASQTKLEDGVTSVTTLRAECRGRSIDHEFVVLQALARLALSALEREDSEGSISGRGLPRTRLNSWLQMAPATSLVWINFSVDLYSDGGMTPSVRKEETEARCLDWRVAFIQRGPSGAVTTACDG